LVSLAEKFKYHVIFNAIKENKFVDCALAANADFLVTNDKHFKILKKIDFPKIETIRAEEFIEKLKQI